MEPRRSSASLGRPRALLACLLPAVAMAQGLPQLPTPSGTRLPDPVELMALRPMEGALDDRPGRVPFRWRGEGITESLDLWTLEKGVIDYGDMLLVADHITYHRSTQRLHAEGHIRMEVEGLRLRCERLDMDGKQRTGEAWALDLELPPTWTLKSDHVFFTTLQHWEFDRVELSPCPQEKPGWSAKLSSLKLDLERFATFRNAWILVDGIPVMYFPWAAYPAKAQRSSGLLPPMLGLAGKLGATLGMAYYQTLGDTADATLAPTWYSKEGVLWGGETRWNPEPAHQGSFQGQVIRQHSDGERRYRYSLKELWQREDGWQLTADVNQASDSLLDSDYGRGVGNLGTSAFDSSVYIGKSFPWASFSVNAAEQRTFFQPDDPFYRADFPTSLKRQTLPSVEAHAYPIPLGSSFYLDGGMRISRLSYRLLLGQDTPNGIYNWGRDDYSARLQGRLGQWGPFRADLQLATRFTRYGATLKDAIFDPNEGSNGESLDPESNPNFDPFRVDGPGTQRFMGSGRLQLSGPQMGRSFEHLDLFGYQGELKHVIEPFFGFTENSKFGEAGRVPRFDEVDSRPGVGGSAMGEQSAEFGFKQHLMGRPDAGQSFADLVRWRVSLKFHFQPILDNDGRYKRGWSAVNNDIDVEPNDTLRVSFRRSSDLGGGSDNALSADLKSKDGSLLNLAFFSSGLDRFLVRQRGIQMGGLRRIWDDRFRLEFQCNFDLHTHAFASSQVALAYMTPCVALTLRYSHLALNTSGSASSLGRQDRLDLVMTLRSLGELFTWRN